MSQRNRTFQVAFAFALSALVFAAPAAAFATTPSNATTTITAEVTSTETTATDESVASADSTTESPTDATVSTDATKATADATKATADATMATTSPIASTDATSTDTTTNTSTDGQPTTAKDATTTTGETPTTATTTDQAVTAQSSASSFDLTAGQQYTVVLQSAVTNSSGNYSRTVIEAAGGSTENLSNVQAWESNGTDAQRWVILMDSNGYCRIMNAKSGLFLDVCNGTAANGTNVWQVAGNKTMAQSWYVEWVDKDAGIVRFLSALNRDYALDLSAASTASGTNIQIWSKNDTAAQSWVMWRADKDKNSTTTSVQSPSTTSGSLPRSSVDGSNVSGYVLVDANGKVMDIAGGSIDNGALAQECAENDTPAQAYKITTDADGYYRIESMKSGKSLTVSAWDVIPGSSLTQQTTISDDLNQLWVARSVNGRTVLVSASTGLAINVWAGTISLETPDGSDEQGWNAKSWSTIGLSDSCYVFYSGVGNNQVLEVAGGSWESGAPAEDYTFNSTSAQRWMVSGSNNSYAIRSVNSGLYLTGSNGSVYQSSDQGAASRWTVSFVFGYGYLFVNSATGQALDVAGASSLPGTTAQLYSRNYSNAQGWRLVGCSMVDDGIYEFMAGNDSSRTLRLDVTGGSDNNGANVQVWGANGSDAQLWRIVSAGGGWYRIYSVNSGKALDVTNWGTTDGTNVQQWTATESSSMAQLWRFELGDHGLQVISRCNDKCLDVSGAGTSWGTNVQMWTKNDSAAQAWHLNPASVYKSLDLFIANLIAIANDNSHGYDQTNRWGPDYDCSSYVITCLENAGFDVGSAWYTGNMRAALVAKGWEWIPDVSNTILQAGDILLNESSHVGVMVSATEIAEATNNEFDGITGGVTGDQDGSEILVHTLNAYYRSYFNGILRFNSSCKLV